MKTSRVADARRTCISCDKLPEGSLLHWCMLAAATLQYWHKEQEAPALTVGQDLRKSQARPRVLFVVYADN